MKRLKGFTIIECVVALLITALTLTLAGWSMNTLAVSNRHSLDSSVDWYVFLKEMEADNHHFVLKQVNSHNIRVNSCRSGLDYILRKRQDTLYLTAWSRGGYMPLFSGVKRCIFKQLPGRRVLVEVTRENGEKLAGIIQFYHE
ncbi:MAG: ComGF family competence protein [Lactobacillaceae bacterium]|nr:ComGF family competence protein [Lactobacillaceae bacterium]